MNENNVNIVPETLCRLKVMEQKRKDKGDTVYKTEGRLL